jgi:hypothetical protein
MSEKEQERLDRHLDKLEEKLPDVATGWLAWIRRPSHRLGRIPLGIVLIFGGIFSILPFLGVWMLPLGLMLLAIDVPALQRPVNAGVLWAERQWTYWKHRFARQGSNRR